MFRKALLTLDRSDLSEAAIPVLASMGPPSAVILEVTESVASILAREVPAFDVPPDVARQIQEREREAIADYLDAIAARLRGMGIEHVDILIREGKPGPRIVEAAQEEGCDLIVMSTHGRSGWQRAVLGSVANYVVTHAEGVPVLLVHPPHDNS